MIVYGAMGFSRKYSRAAILKLFLRVPLMCVINRSCTSKNRTILHFNALISKNKALA